MLATDVVGRRGCLGVVAQAHERGRAGADRLTRVLPQVPVEDHQLDPAALAHAGQPVEVGARDRVRASEQQRAPMRLRAARDPGDQPLHEQVTEQFGDGRADRLRGDAQQTGVGRRHQIGLVVGSRAFDGTLTLTLPAGARASSVPSDDCLKALRGLPAWTRIAASTDVLTHNADASPARPEPPLSMPERLLEVWHGAFAWIAVAVAVPPDEVATLAATVAAAARDARSRAQGSPDQAIRLARLEGELTELRRAAAAGLWRLHLLAGGVDARSARRIGAVLAASADLGGLPHMLLPTPVLGSFDEVLDQPSWRAEHAQTPFLAPSALVAALLEPPRREVPGIRLRLRSEFDTTPEASSGPDPLGGPDRTGHLLELGRVLDRNGAPVGPLPVSTSSLVRHTLVAGATGAGKSQTVRHLLEQASRVGLPWLVIEPSKAEYRAMAARLPDRPLLVIRPGDVRTPPAGVNPLEPAPGFPMQTHVDLVRALFNAAFMADDPFPQVLSAALIRCFERQGWHLALGAPRVGVQKPRIPTLADLQRAAEDVVGDIGYGGEVTDNVRGFIRIRLRSLRLGTTGRFFEGGHPLDFERMMRGRVVVELDDVGDDQDKAFLMGTLLIRLVEHLRVAGRRTDGGDALAHLTVVEEAHRLLRGQVSGPAAHAIEVFAALLAEIRAYGEGVVIAEQIPTKLIPDVIKNTAVKVVHRLPARDDRDAVGAAMNLTEAQSGYLVTLPPGTAAVFTDGMDYPILARMPDGTAREAAGRQRGGGPGEVGTIISRRSGSCGADCGRQPCDLTEIETARHYPDQPDATWWRLWAELCVVAHLTGWAAPPPRAGLLRAAARLPPRLTDCMIGHLADAAVMSRSAVIVRTADPDALSVHIAQTMRGVLRGGAGCPAEEPEWLAAPFRWCLVWDTLRTLVRERPDAPRHPRTEQWQQRYGRRITGANAAEQLALVQSWYTEDEQDRGSRREVFFGIHEPSAIEQAVGAAATSEQWPTRLARALADFGQPSWARRYLTSS